MPLDPQAQAFLEQLAASGAPPLHELSVAEARQVIVTLFGVEGDPEPVGAVVDRMIPGAAGEISARMGVIAPLPWTMQRSARAACYAPSPSGSLVWV